MAEVRLPFSQHTPDFKAGIDQAPTFGQMDMSDDERAVVDRLVDSLRARPDQNGDVHILRPAGDYKDMHLRRSDGIYVLYQLFSRVGQTPPRLVRLWYCGRYTEAKGCLYLDFAPDMPLAVDGW